jgi:hypothetical protein
LHGRAGVLLEDGASNVELDLESRDVARKYYKLTNRQAESFTPVARGYPPLAREREVERKAWEMREDGIQRCKAMGWSAANEFRCVPSWPQPTEGHTTTASEKVQGARRSTLDPWMREPASRRLICSRPLTSLFCFSPSI